MTAVAPIHAVTTPPETRAQKIARLSAEIKSLSREEATDFLTSILQSVERAKSCADNPFLPDGIREIARKFALDNADLHLSLQSLLERGNG